jgi:hypothetical protein
MDFGIVTAKVDEIGYITHAENLGYTHCWVTDSQMIRSNCWAVLALAAQQTRTMRLGTGGECPGLTTGPGDGQWHCHHQPTGARALFHESGHRPHGHAHARPETDAVKTVS